MKLIISSYIPLKIYHQLWQTDGLKHVTTYRWSNAKSDISVSYGGPIREHRKTYNV